MTMFERHPKVTLVAIVLTSGVLIVAALELSLRLFFGLGHPLLYRSSPLFGYRLQPHQHVHRRGVDITVNNLGLRAERHWDENIENKILFLGNSVTFGGTYVGNSDLFSQRAVSGLDGYAAGNAGVNGWGVENIKALVVDYEFLPARTVVSVLQEMDFYRGLAKLAGKPFWTVKPAFALQELLAAFYLDRLNEMYEGNERFVSPLENERAVERSCVQLKIMDDFLKTKGYRHLIFLSTNTNQLLRQEPDDTLVTRCLQRCGISVIRLRERPEIRSLSPEEQQALFYDWNHLSTQGHALIGKIINTELRKVLQR
jgi:hypothetical protein